MIFQSPRYLNTAVLLLASHIIAFYLGHSISETPEVQPADIAVKTIPLSCEPSTGKTAAKNNKKELKPRIKNSNNPTINKATVDDNLKNIVKQMHPNQLNSYLSKYFDKDDLEKINDREAFAQRLLDLYSGENSATEQQWDSFDAEMVIGINENYPQQLNNHLSIASEENKIYAHLKLNQSPSFLSEVFVRWKRVADNKLLLFEKKLFNPTSNTHWVSVIPHGGWQDGEYHVDFYSFDSQMQPIASQSYFLSVVPKADN